MSRGLLGLYWKARRQSLPDEGPDSLTKIAGMATRLFDTLISLWKPEQGILTDSDIRWVDGVIPSDIPAYKRYP